MLSRNVLEASRPRATSVIVWSVVLVFEALLLALYTTARGVDPALFHIYPFIWLNASVWVVWNVDSLGGSRRHRLLATAVAGGYFLVLAYFGGLFDVALTGTTHAGHGGLRLETVLPPGYGPAMFYTGSVVQLSILPYLLVGYLALTYLVYVTVLEASKAAAGGVFGLFACVGCSWPIFASIATGATGGGASIATAVYAQSYEISTVAFLLTVALLYWRPFVR